MVACAPTVILNRSDNGSSVGQGGNSLRMGDHADYEAFASTEVYRAALAGWSPPPSQLRLVNPNNH